MNETNSPERPDMNTPPPSRPSVAEIKALFSRRSVWQSWLDVEATLAEVQAELGVIPRAAAEEIRRKASFEHVDEQALARDVAVTRAPVLSLSHALAAACQGDAGRYVHWGATTQNVSQTGRTLLMRRAHRAFMARYADLLEKLAGMAERSADMLVAGRTNHRHALPITFGFKVAAWIEEFLRHRDRLLGAEPRVFTSLWGGAIGAMHAFGEHGAEINRRLSSRLGLAPLAVPSRAGTDHVAEYVLLLALFGASCSKIAREFYALMADEVEEVYEGLGDEVIGSSTMPHKVNSKVAVHVIALAARLRAQVPLAFDAVQPTHEGDAANNQMLYMLMDGICPLAYELVCGMDDLLACIRLAPERMRRNLAATGPFMAAENAMMLLAASMGRAEAHEIVHHAAARAVEEDAALVDLLLEQPAVRAAVSEGALRAALDPSNYTGSSGAMARTMAAAARAAAAALRRHQAIADA